MVFSANLKNNKTKGSEHIQVHFIGSSAFRFFSLFFYVSLFSIETCILLNEYDHIGWIWPKIDYVVLKHFKMRKKNKTIS